MAIIFVFWAEFSPSVRTVSALTEGASEARVSNVLVVFPAGLLAALLASSLVANGALVPALGGTWRSPTSLPPPDLDRIAVCNGIIGLDTQVTSKLN